VGPTEALAKFLECAAIALGDSRAATALDLVRSFERLPDVRRLTETLAVPEAAR
jgi:hypothetical protein